MMAFEEFIMNRQYMDRFGDVRDFVDKKENNEASQIVEYNTYGDKIIKVREDNESVTTIPNYKFIEKLNNENEKHVKWWGYKQSYTTTISMLYALYKILGGFNVFYIGDTTTQREFYKEYFFDRLMWCYKNKNERLLSKCFLMGRLVFMNLDEYRKHTRFTNNSVFIFDNSEVILERVYNHSLEGDYKYYFYSSDPKELLTADRIIQIKTG